MSVSTQNINALVLAGALTTSLAVQEAAAEQVNTATTGSTGTDAATTNEAWGKAVPQLIGHTRSVCLPLWTGNPVATITDNGDEVDTIDFAVYVGRPGLREKTATLLRIWFDNVLVYDAEDASVTTLTGATLAFTFYDGSQGTPDPTIAKAELGATPAFTNTMYIVFTNLTTRIIDATTTTTQFTKLPQVQVEVQQSQPSVRNGAVVYPFKTPNIATDGPIHANCYSAKKGQYYIFTDTLVSTYDVASNTLLGRTGLQNFGADTYPGRNSPQVLAEDGIFYGVGGGIWWTAYDPVSGSVLGRTHRTDPKGKNLPDFSDYGGLTDLGAGFLLHSLNQSNLVYFDGTDFYACNFDGFGTPAAQTLQCESVFSFPNCPTFKGIGMSYLTGNGSNVIRRIVLTPKGDKSLAVPVGVITADGSNTGVNKGSRMDVVYTLPAHETFAAVMVDRSDATKVYALVYTAAGACELRTYATFYHWNPPVGTTAPATTPAIYQNYDLLTELSRMSIPDIFLNDDKTYIAFKCRDKRYNSVVLSSKGSALVLDYKVGSYRQYLAGDYYNPAGQQLGTFPFFPGTLIKLGPDDVFLCSGMEYYGNGHPELAAQVQFPAKLRPASKVQAEAPYSLENLYMDLAALAGYDLTDVQCFNMDDTITGLQLNQTVNFTDLMAQLNAVFRVDMLEQPDGTLQFVRQIDKRAPDFIITPDRLLPAGSDASGNTVAIDRVATNELPTLLQLSFINQDFGFQVGAATVKRVSYPEATAFGNSFLALSIPVVMTGIEATYYAGIALFDMWAGKQNFQINLPPMFFFLVPGDFVELIRPSGRADLCKITEISLGQDRTIAVTLSGVGALKPVPFMQAANKPGSVPVEDLPVSYGTFTTASPTGTYATVIDNVGMPGDIAAGDVPLYLVSNVAADFYAKLGTAAPVKIGSTVGNVMGAATSQLSDPGNAVATTSEVLTLSLYDATQLVPASGEIAIGAPGRWEVVDYAAAVVNGAAVTLSGLTRGRLGTQAALAGHKVGDTVVFGPTGLLRASLPVSALGTSIVVYAMKPGAGAAATGGVVDTLPVTGSAVAPLVPLFPQATRLPNGNVLLTWYRQDPAVPAGFFDPVPLSFAPEQYAVTVAAVRNGLVGVRNFTPNTTSVEYTHDDMVSDSNDAAVRLNVTIAQTSAVVGAGPAYKGYVYVQ